MVLVIGRVAAWQVLRFGYLGFLCLLVFGLGCKASGNRSAASAQRRAAGAECWAARAREGAQHLPSPYRELLRCCGGRQNTAKWRNTFPLLRTVADCCARHYTSQIQSAE
jgi:hypothetical protein